MTLSVLKGAWKYSLLTIKHLSFSELLSRLHFTYSVALQKMVFSSISKTFCKTFKKIIKLTDFVSVRHASKITLNAAVSCSYCGI